MFASRNSSVLPPAPLPSACGTGFDRPIGGIERFREFGVHSVVSAADERQMTAHDESHAPSAFGACLRAARHDAGLSKRSVAKRSGVPLRRVTALDAGTGVPTDRELGALAQACRVSVFDLLPSGYSLRLLAQDEASGPREVSGPEAMDALLREYLSMVVEMRAGRPVTAPTLRHEDLVELAAALGDDPEAIGARLVELLDAQDADASVLVSMILPSTASD
jgi:transcriptional regulator with XRE-family HTH domain